MLLTRISCRYVIRAKLTFPVLVLLLSFLLSLVDVRSEASGGTSRNHKARKEAWKRRTIIQKITPIGNNAAKNQGNTAVIVSNVRRVIMAHKSICSKKTGSCCSNATKSPENLSQTWSAHKWASLVARTCSQSFPRSFCGRSSSVHEAPRLVHLSASHELL